MMVITAIIGGVVIVPPRLVIVLPGRLGRREDHADQCGQGNMAIAQAEVIGRLRRRTDRVPDLGRQGLLRIGLAGRPARGSGSGDNVNQGL
jgi:hypothetical protein